MENKKYDNFFNKFVLKYMELNKENKVPLQRKIDHSYRVKDFAIRIAKSLNLNEEDLENVYIIAMFHDLGRFVQFNKYKTFSDLKTVDHAKLSVEILEESNILDNVKDKKLILKSIFLHNKKEIPQGLSEREYLFTTIIRDADKIDGFEVITNIVPNYPREEQLAYYGDLEKGNVSKEILENIIQNKVIDFKQITNKTEKQILVLGFISSDIKNNESLKIIKERKYVDKMEKLINNTPETKIIVKHIRDFLGNF